MINRYGTFIGDLDMKCGSCPIINYCNDYEETPPCSQKRFKRVSCNLFLELAEKSTATSRTGMYDEIEEQLEN